MRREKPRERERSWASEEGGRLGFRGGGKDTAWASLGCFLDLMRGNVDIEAVHKMPKLGSGLGLGNCNRLTRTRLLG